MFSVVLEKRRFHRHAGYDIVEALRGNAVMYGEALQIYYDKKIFFTRFDVQSEKMLSLNAILNSRILHMV